MNPFVKVIVTTSSLLAFYSNESEIYGLSIGIGNLQFEDSDQDKISFPDKILCKEKGSFSFPGLISYKQATQACKSRGGNIFIYSFNLACDESVFYSIFLDAICLQDCNPSYDKSEIYSIIETKLKITYPKCLASEINFTIDSSIGPCLDDTREIGSEIELLTEQLNMKYTIENDTINFSDEDISSFSNECVNKSGKVITSSFSEESMKDSKIPGKCPFSDLLNHTRLNTTVAKVNNQPRCFSRSCSPQIIMKLLSLPENPSKWYCDRDVYSVNFNSAGDLEPYNYSKDTRFDDDDIVGNTPLEEDGKQESNAVEHDLHIKWIGTMFMFLVTIMLL